MALQIVAMASQKGGCGKTTLALNLAGAAIEAGVKTCIFDLDPQMSATRFYDKRCNSEFAPDPETIPIQLARLPIAIKTAIRQGFELAILDMPPNIGQENFLICQAADFLLMPTLPDSIDLDSIEASIQIASTVKTPGAVVLNRVQAAGAKTAIAEARDFIEVQCSYPMMAQTIGQRKAFNNALKKDGLPVVVHAPKDKAATEIRALWAEVALRLKVISKEQRAAA